MGQHSPSGMRRRLPAYACALMFKRQQGLAPQGDLLIATDWRLGRAWTPWRIVVDPCEDPVTFDFSVCAGLSCLLAGRQPEHLDAAARAIIPFAPLRLIGVDYRTPRIQVFWPSGAPQGQVR